MMFQINFDGRGTRIENEGLTVSWGHVEDCVATNCRTERAHSEFSIATLNLL